MRVLQAYNIFGALTERVWLEVPERLSSRGYSPVWICESIAAESPSLDPPPVVLPRIEVHSDADVEAEMSAIARMGPPLLLADGIDLAHGHTGPRLLRLAPLLSRGVPCVISLYGFDASRLLRDQNWEARYRWAAARGARFVVLCDAMRQRLLRAGLPDGSVSTIHLGVDLQAWRFDPQPAVLPHRFIFVGRLQEKKGVEHLIRALAIAPGHYLLDIVGDGPLRGSLEALAQSLGLADRVRFHGRVDRRAVGDLLRGATVFVLPSIEAADGDSEGTPIVLMEALANGVPCITTQHAGNAEVLPPSGKDFAVTPGDPISLANAMSRMTTLSGAERTLLQQAGRQWVELEFDLQHTVDQYERLYAALIRGVSPCQA